MSETLANAKTYFAVQIESYEKAPEIAKLILTLAWRTGLKFLRLESMDTLTVGTTNLLRFRSDMTDASPILNTLAKQGRGVILHEGAQYVMRKATRSGTIPTSRMLITPCHSDQQKVYLGTAVKTWADQF